MDDGIPRLALRPPPPHREGNRVVAHLPYSGTQRGAIAGVDATGSNCAVDEKVIFRLADRKMVEAWEVYDEAGMWRQLGVMRRP